MFKLLFYIIIIARILKQLEEYEVLRNNGYVTKELVSRVAYNYVNGPFKGLNIRYGYNALVNPESRYIEYYKHFTC